MDAPPADTPLGRIGRYALVRELGRGGNGVVYEAVLLGPAGFRKPVAIKVLRGEAGDLVHEARLGGLLRHPNLVEVYELGRIDDRDGEVRAPGGWFVAMELVTGGSLAGRVLPQRAVVEVGLQVCAALAHAHTQIGLVHLDLKPGNLLVEDGRVKVADLGVARAAGFDGDGRIRCTPRYAAPELLAGREVDARADVYALGVVLSELATGERSDTATTIDFEGRAEPALARCPAWLEPIWDRCTALHATDRYPSMAALAEALAAITVAGPGLADALQAAGAGVDLGTPGTLVPRRTNLDADLEAAIGRDVEVGALADRLREPGQLTLCGPAGVGKSRLAREGCRAWVEGAAGRQVWLADLATASGSDEVVAAVAAALDLPVGRTAEAQLGHALAARDPVVLVLDNADRVDAAVAALIPRWRELAPRARFVVTSRAPLGVRGERVVRVEPLEVSSAVALLVARAADRGVSLPDDPAVTELARRLDGLPLALELAAARLAALTPTQMLARLDQRLRLLRREDRRDPRHAALVVALDDAWELLEPADRVAVARCSVFAGSFPLEAAEAVLDPEPGGWVVDQVDRLVDRSWLVARNGRIAMLESARVYAAARLDALGQRADAEWRHGEWYANQFGREAATAALYAHRGEVQLAAMAAEFAELAEAARRAIARGDVAQALPLVRATHHLCEVRGPLSTSWELGCRALEIPGLSAEARARLGGITASSARRVAPDRALHLADAAVDAASESGDPMVIGALRCDRGLVLRELGDVRRAVEDLEAGVGILRQHPGANNFPSRLANLAHAYAVVGRIDDAMRAFDDALGAMRASGNHRGLAAALGNRGLLHTDLGRYPEAEADLREAGALAGRVGHRAVEATVLGNLGMILALQGRRDEAEREIRRALAVARDIGDLRLQGVARTHLADLLAQTDPDAGRRAFEEALDTHRAVGNRRFEAFALLQLAHLDAADRAMATRAVQRADRAVEIAEAVGDANLLGLSLAARADAALAIGDGEAAAAALDRIGTLGLAPDNSVFPEVARLRARIGEAPR